MLTDRGLGPALEALVLRSPIPVEVDVLDERLPPAIEAAAYYVAAESLANVVKYAHASAAHVEVFEGQPRGIERLRDRNLGRHGGRNAREQRELYEEPSNHESPTPPNAGYSQHSHRSF